MLNKKKLTKISYIIFVVIKYCSATDDFLLINKYEGDKYYCITNSSSALSWILEDTTSNTNLTQESRFLPTSENLFKITCSTIREPCQESFANNITLDRRWEKFPVYKTDYVEDAKNYYSPLKLTTVEQDLKNNFVVPFSVRLSQEAHLFLCEGNNITTSNCYWLIIDGFKGTKTGIRKCPKNTIPRLNNKPIKGSCATFKMEHTYESPQHLSRQQWKHFKLTKINNWIILTNLNDESLISFNDTDNVFNVKYMIIHSKSMTGIWKIHKLKYFTFTEEGQLRQQEVKPIQDVVCISAFVKMCNSCSILVEIKKEKMSNNVLESQTYQLQTSDWKEIKFIKTDIKAKDVILIFTAISSQKENMFWAIDGIYQCAKDGFRMITLNEAAHCQILSSNNSTTIKINNKVNVNSELDECDEHTVGKFCLPCRLFLNDDCGKLKFCEFHNNKHLCSCSAGFRANDSGNCKSPCENGKYGWNCKKQCSENCDGCKNIDGTCDSCRNNYEGRMCAQTPRLIFKEAPTVVNYTYNEALIEMRNFEFSRKVYYPTKSTVQFRIQYKMNSDKKTWTDGEKYYDINQRQNISIRNLKPGKQYFVRSIIYLNRKAQESDEIPQNKFTTKCDVAKVNELKVNVSDTSATVAIKEEHQFRICQFHNDKIRVEVSPPAEKFSYMLNAKIIHINGLNAFSDYNINIIEKNTNQFLTSITIHTTEGIPEQVLDPVAENITNVSIILKWSQPTLHGELKHYVVTHQIVKDLGCKDPLKKSSQKQQQETQNTFVTLSDLSPYKEYEFTVFAANSKFEGPPQTIREKTLESRIIFDEEFSEIKVTTQPSTRSVTVGFSSVICDKLRGPLLVVLNAICVETWCKNGSATHQFNFDSTSLTTIADIWPFTKYTLQLKFCRNNLTICSENFRYETFKTEPEPPSPVKDLSVYKKNNHSISIRWKPPHPPTGVIELFNIHIYNGYLNFNRTVNVTNSSCSLWNDFQCFTINDLENDVGYNIDIKAKNKLLELGQLITVSTITKTEISQKPDGLTVRWNIKNDLLIKWEHPTKANGDIQFFEINVLPPAKSSGPELRYNHTIEKEKYLPVYTHTIPANDLLNSIEYKITIRAFNDLYGQSTEHKEWSPPEIPLFDSEPNLTSSNETITIKTSKIKMLNSKNKYKLFLLLFSDDINNRSLYTTFQNLEKLFDIHLPTFRILYECDPYSGATEFVIGKTNNSVRNCKNNGNLSLNPATNYNITILLVNDDGRKESYKFYSYEIFTEGELPILPNDLRLLALLLLLLLIPIIVIIFIKRRTIIEKLSTMKQAIFNNRDDDNEISGEKTPLSASAVPLKTIQNAQVQSKKIKLADLEAYVKESLKNGELERQHALFPRGQTKPWECGALKENKSKNRYTNLVAYDHTRVILRKINGQPHSDYINANYIDGYKINKAYIATQGPKISTVNDFWRMIWQENVQHIAMLANIYEGEKKKVEKYWPDKNENLPFGNITVTQLSSDVFADYEHRIFQVTYKNETRQIQQYHFLSWPDHGVPLYSQSLVPFLQTIQNIPLSSSSPVVVHCSAGVGRTGTIILCDICLRMASKEKAVDILRNLQLLRDQRPNMVDNVLQYKLVHLVILEYLFGMKTGIMCKEIDVEVETLIKSDEIKHQLKYLEDTAWQDQIMKSVVQKKDTFIVIKEKNRYQAIVPEIQGSIFLPRYPLNDESSTYINAVYVDGFRSPKRFIVTQQPMPNTLGDFWRLIHEKEISVIISLNEINLKNNSSCYFWPSESKDMHPVDYITLKQVGTHSLEFYEVTTIHLQINQSEEYKTVKIIALKRWPAKTPCPSNITTFVSFYQESSAIARQSKSVVLTCFDGALASGLYVALSFVLEKINLEQICDVCQAVRAVRHNRNQFVQTKEQFEFLYRAAMAYVTQFQTYANFN